LERGRGITERETWNSGVDVGEWGSCNWHALQRGIRVENQS